MGSSLRKIKFTLHINYMNSEEGSKGNPEPVTPESLAEMPYAALLDKAERMIDQLNGFTPENVDEALPLTVNICGMTNYVGFRPEKEKLDRGTLEKALVILENAGRAMDQVEQTIFRALRILFPDLTLQQMRDGLLLGQKIAALGFKPGSLERKKYQAMEWMLMDTIHGLRLPSRLPYRIDAIKKQLQKIEEGQSSPSS